MSTVISFGQNIYSLTYFQTQIDVTNCLSYCIRIFSVEDIRYHCDKNIFATTNIPVSHRLTKINKSIFAHLRQLQKIRNRDIINTNFVWLNDTSVIKKFERWQNGVLFTHCQLNLTYPTFVFFHCISGAQLFEI